MPKIIDFQIITEKGQRPAMGEVMWAHIGTQKIKFVLQREERGHDAHLLTHFASGRIVAKLAPIRLARYTANPYSFAAYRDRDFAQIAIDGLIATHGEEKLLTLFNGATVINTSFKR